MLKKGLFILSFAFGLAVHGQNPESTKKFAQKFTYGVKYGQTLSKSNLNLSDQVFWQQPYVVGQNAGLRLQYKLNRIITLAADIEYIQKNIRLERSGPYGGPFYELKKKYLQVPLQIQMHWPIGKKSSFYVTLGGYAGYWYSAAWNTRDVVLDFDMWDDDVLEILLNEERLNIAFQEPLLRNHESVYDFDSSYDNDNKKDQRFDAGILAGVGFSFQLPKKLLVNTIGVEASFQQSITSAEKFKSSAKPLNYQSTQNRIFNACVYLTLPMSFTVK